MTTPRDDISGLSERLREWVGHVHSLKSRLSSRSRSEIFYPGSLAPELLRRSEEMLGEVVEHGREAYDAIDALQARVKELEGYRALYEASKGAVVREQSRALRAEQERDEAVDLLRKMTDNSIDDALYPFAECFDTARDLVRRLAGPEKEGK